MKETIIGGFLFLSGCILFSCCMLYTAFEGCVPSDVRGEKLMAVFLLVVGAGIMTYSALKDRRDK